MKIIPVRSGLLFFAFGLALAAYAQAADVAITWQYPEPGAPGYRIFVAQPDASDKDIRVVTVLEPTRLEADVYAHRIRDVDALRASFYIVTAVDALGFAGPPSEVFELTPLDFCPTMDVDGDGRVTAGDALLAARRAVGLPTLLAPPAGESSDPTVVRALEILRFAAAAVCA